MSSTIGDDAEALAAARFRVLGPVAVMGTVGEPLPLGPPRRRTLLAALLVHARSPLSVDQLTELLWDGSPPPTAATMVHGAVAGLRHDLTPMCGGIGPPLLATRDGGYALDVPAWDVDVWNFEQLVARGRRSLGAAPVVASRSLAEALALWRGPALSGIELAFARDAAGRWEELRLECLELQIEAELALGHHAEVIAGLEELVARHPFRERLSAHLMVALYRCGRQADALRKSRTLRRTLAAELGIEPGPEVEELEQSILRHSGNLAVPVTSSARTSLPAPFNTFVGRAREREDVAALLGTRRLVTLIGPGGSGKTRLALEVTRQRAARGTDDSWLVDLAPLSTPALFGETVAEALGIRAAPARGLDASIAAALADRTGTVLLDNCEHLVEACAAFAETVLASAPGVRLLTTSRTALQVPGEQVYTVPPLATASESDGWQEIAACEAVRLFAERASAARPGFAVTPANAALVLEVCRRLDGLPLAVELAAARVASMPLRALAERLDDRFRLLDPVQRQAGDRHHSLAAAMAWSHDLLPLPERLLFARVSVFPGSFTLTAAEDVASRGPADADAAADVATLLGGLVSGSILQLEDGPDGEGRYRMLETTRQYGRERLDGPTMATLCERHALHYLALAQQAEPHLLGAGSTPWLTRLHAEHDNFRAALEWSFSAGGDPLVGARLVACLWHPWDLRGLRGEGLHWVGAGLRAVGADRPLERLPLLSAGALFHLGRGEFAQVAELTVEQVALARSTATPMWEGDALASDATVAWASGQFDRAQQLYEDAVAASLAGGDRWRAALAEAQLARLHRDRDEPDAARAAASRAQDRAEQVGEELACGLSLDVLASVEQRWGDAAAARRLVDGALAHYRKLGYVEGEASAYQVAGRVALGSSDLEVAREAFEHSLRLCRRIGHRGGSAAALEGLADAAAETGDGRRAVLLLGAASALRDEIGAPLTGSARARRLEQRRRFVEQLGPELVDRILRQGARLQLDVLVDEERDPSVHA
jgi:predicted ATPase/DNA-binding SARP family transcriptional activator